MYVKGIEQYTVSCSQMTICSLILEVGFFNEYVPFQGSAKLEKAEILQMTVDHLKMLQATGGKGKTFTVCTFTL